MTDRSAAFPRASRLTRPQEFKRVLSGPDWRRDGGPMRILIKANRQEQARLGLVVPKRWVRHAHDRNRCKRVVREAFRHLAHALPAVDIVIMIRGRIDASDISLLIRRLLMSVPSP